MDATDVEAMAEQYVHGMLTRIDKNTVSMATDYFRKKEEGLHYRNVCRNNKHVKPHT